VKLVFLNYALMHSLLRLHAKLDVKLSITFKVACTEANFSDHVVIVYRLWSLKSIQILSY